jgi:import receptor subunit TOM70
MDAGKVEESLEMFNAALGIDPNATDAYLHRANLKMLQMNSDEARNDLEKCLSLQPNHLLAQLRLATVLMASNDIDGAKKCLEKAERINPRSSEVHSYRGEMHFAQEEYEEAKKEFDKAIECEPNNPTPYVNAALALMNTPSLTGTEIEGAINLLSKAVEVNLIFLSLTL